MVGRVALIIGSFRHTRTMRLDQVADRTGLPRSSVHRILTQLHEAGLLVHGPDGYRLQGASVAGGTDHSRLRGVASPVLRRLQTDTGLVVHLGVLRGAEVHYLDKVAGHGSIPVPARVADRTPAHASASGKAMLAALTPETVDQLLPTTLRACTPATITKLSALHQDLARIRSRHGLAYDDQELAVGLASIAAPIATGDDEIAGLALTCATPVLRLNHVAPFLTRAARGISEHLRRDNAAPRAPLDSAAFTDDMLSRVLRTLSSDDWV